MGSSFMASSKQLLIRWALSRLTLDQCPPCVEVLQWEVEAAGGMLALALLMAVAAKSSSLVTSVSLLAFTKGGNTFALLTVMECSLMSVIQFLLREALSNL